MTPLLRLVSPMLILGALALEPAPLRAGPAADPGARLWLQCRACHALKAGEGDKVGPNLHDLFGAKAASLRPTYPYSPALKASGIVWDEERLDAWLRQPTGVVRGTRMAYPGLADADRRKALIAWLKRETR